jgi:hypothetical protein
MVTYNNDGNVEGSLQGFPVPGHIFRLIAVTHDESTFHVNDWRKTKWVHAAEKNVPQPKGEGQSLMVSDFLTVEWGCLKDKNE